MHTHIIIHEKASKSKCNHDIKKNNLLEEYSIFFQSLLESDKLVLELNPNFFEVYFELANIYFTKAIANCIYDRNIFLNRLIADFEKFISRIEEFELISFPERPIKGTSNLKDKESPKTRIASSEEVWDYYGEETHNKCVNLLQKDIKGYMNDLIENLKELVFEQSNANLVKNDMTTTKLVLLKEFGFTDELRRRLKLKNSNKLEALMAEVIHIVIGGNAKVDTIRKYLPIIEKKVGDRNRAINSISFEKANQILNKANLNLEKIKKPKSKNSDPTKTP